MDWTVTLICGAAGVGKSRLAAGLSNRYAVPLAEVDDIVTALMTMTDPAHHPALHYWDTHPEAQSWDAERIAEHHMRVASALRPALTAVIADHVESRAPVILEGDYLTPELAETRGGAVRAVLVSEPDDDQLVANLRVREPDVPAQRKRVSVSRLVETELARRSMGLGVPVVSARPWDTAEERADQALRG